MNRGFGVMSNGASVRRKYSWYTLPAEQNECPGANGLMVMARGVCLFQKRDSLVYEWRREASETRKIAKQIKRRITAVRCCNCRATRCWSLEIWQLRLRAQNFPRCFDQRGCLCGGTDCDAQIVTHFRRAEPADENFSVAQFLQSLLSREQWRLCENEIGLTRKNAESESGQIATQFFARGDNFPEVSTIIIEL